MPSTSFSSVVQKLQAECFPKRIRPLDAFKDFDTLRKSEITESQFQRCLKNLMPQLSPKEWEAVIEHCGTSSGNVNYKILCQEVENVFTTKGLRQDPLKESCKPGGLLPKSKLQPADAEMEAILHRCALLNRTRGMVMKYAFEDCDRGDASSILFHRRAGKITESQFRRAFPLEKDFGPAELDKIVARYRDDDGNVDYIAFHDEVTDPVDVVKDAPIPTSHFIVHEDVLNQKWSKTDYSILDRVTAKIIMLRVRIEDYFLDFDNLRRGACTAKQVDTVFGILGLNFTEEEMQQLKSKYSFRDLNLTMFNYAAFCADVNRAFTYKEVHRDPLAKVEMLKSEQTLPSRRSKQALTEEERARILEIEADIRLRVSKRQLLFVNNFKDFDRSYQGHVTVAQFARVMQTLGLASGLQDTSMLDLLAKKYCDLDSPMYFNYREFTQACDPPSAILHKAEMEAKEPYEKPRASRYFDRNGKVFDVTDGSFKGES